VPGRNRLVGAYHDSPGRPRFLIFLVTGYTAPFTGLGARANLEAGSGLICRGPGIPECWAMAGRRCGSRNFLFRIKDLPAPPKNPPIAFTACHGSRSASFCRIQKTMASFYFQKPPQPFFSGLGTWIHDGLNRIVPSLGRFSVPASNTRTGTISSWVRQSFSVSFSPCYRENLQGFWGSASHQPEARRLGTCRRISTRCCSLRGIPHECRTLLVFSAWHGQKKRRGYLSNPHSNDEIDLAV